MKHSMTGAAFGSALATVLAAAVLSGCTSERSVTADTQVGATGSGTVGATGSGTDAATGSGAVGAGGQACADGQLKVAIASDGSAGGHTGLILSLTNTGAAPCSVQGYPGAGVTDRSGEVVLNATRLPVGYLGGQYPSPATIMLAPGATASTVIEWLDAPPNGDTPVGANCPGMDGGRLLITPPNTRRSASFSAPANLCADFEVHPLVPGGSGRATA